MGDPFRNELGDTQPPEGSEKRRKLMERVDALLKDLEKFAREPLVTRPFIDPERGALWCQDCNAMFELDDRAGHTRATCPRCTSAACVPFAPRPLVGTVQT